MVVFILIRHFNRIFSKQMVETLGRRRILRLHPVQQTGRQAYITPCRRQSKTSITPTDDKWQSNTLFLAIFDPRSSIVKSVYDCRLPGVYMG